MALPSGRMVPALPDASDLIGTELLPVWQTDGMKKLPVASLRQAGDPVSVARYIPQGQWAALAAGTSGYDCTGSFNAALAANRHVVVPPWVFNLGNVRMNHGNVLASMLPPATGSIMHWDATSISRSAPRLRAIGGSISIIDVQGVYYPTIRGLHLDGLNTVVNGISGGSYNGAFECLVLIRCGRGIGGSALTGADNYTHEAELRSVQAAYCTSGLFNFIDTQAIGITLTDCTIGVEMLTGAHSNEFVAGRYEWCTAQNIYLFESSNNRFVGGLVDSGYGEGAAIASCAGTNTFTGMAFNRNARSGSGEESVHVALLANPGTTAFSNVTFRAGVDDDGGGPMRPEYLFRFFGVNGGLIVNSPDLGGYTNAQWWTGPLPDMLVMDGPGIERAGRGVIQNARRPFLLDGQSVQHRVVHGGVAAGATQVFPLGQVGAIAFSQASRELTITTTDLTSGAVRAARFPVILSRGAGGAALLLGTAFGEAGATGYFGTGSGTIRLSVGNVAADGTTFDLSVQNTGANSVGLTVTLA